MTRTLSSLALLLAIALGIAPSPPRTAQEPVSGVGSNDVAAASSEGRGLSPTVAALRGAPHAEPGRGDLPVEAPSSNATSAPSSAPQPAVVPLLAAQPVTETLVDSASMPVPTPTGSVGTALIGGWATFYDTCPDCAAAGPTLREALGPGWRGERVDVVSGSRSVTVRLTDWCACGTRHGTPTLLDVSEEAFVQIAPLSDDPAIRQEQIAARNRGEVPRSLLAAGLVRVSIEIAGPRNPDDDRMRVEDGGPTPPATDAAP